MEQKLLGILLEIKDLKSDIRNGQLAWGLVYLFLIIIYGIGVLNPGVNRTSLLGRDLTGLQIIDTEIVPCGEDSEGEMEWVNNTGKNVYITSVNIWMGMYKGSISDFAVWLQRHGRESTLLRSNWDHYADPVSPDHYIEKDYAPHHVTVLDGESLTLHYSCSNIDDSNAHGHATVLIWYYQ